MRKRPLNDLTAATLYTYVGNDPANRTDPSGLECVTVKDDFHCSPPPGSPKNLGSFDVPKQAGHPSEISSREGGYHQYHAQTSTTKTGQGVLKSVAQAVINHPVPNSAGSPASTQGTTNYAGITPFNGGPLSDKVKSFVTTDSNGNTVVVNLTIPGQHILNPGYVAQYVTQSSSGTAITVVGEGNAYIQVGPGAAIGSAVFQNRIEKDMKEGLDDAAK